MINLQNGDILELKNGKTLVFTEDRRWVMSCYYDNDLRCLSNDDYTVVAIKRPSYEYVYKRVR